MSWADIGIKPGWAIGAIINTDKHHHKLGSTWRCLPVVLRKNAHGVNMVSLLLQGPIVTAAQPI